jgi:hypothetical protein
MLFELLLVCFVHHFDLDLLPVFVDRILKNETRRQIRSENKTPDRTRCTYLARLSQAPQSVSIPFAHYMRLVALINKLGALEVLLAARVSDCVDDEGSYEEIVHRVPLASIAVAGPAHDFGPMSTALISLLLFRLGNQEQLKRCNSS